jgi:hypothetical protein
MRRVLLGCLLLLIMTIVGSVRAEPGPAEGVAVLAIGDAREDAFAAARAVYTTTLRPSSLDELRARVLAGDPAPPTATKELRELAELRGAVHGDDAPSRNLLASIAQQLRLEGILLVGREAAEADAGSPPAVFARLFLASSGELDAARYAPDPASPTPWRATVASVAARFPKPAQAVRHVPPATMATPDPKEKKPFYASPWLWGAIGATLALGAFFYFVGQDTSDDPIHLQMRVPR